MVGRERFWFVLAQNCNKAMRKGSINTKTPNHLDFPATKPTSKLNFNNNHQENELETEQIRSSDPSEGNIRQQQFSIENSCIPRLNEQLKPPKYAQYINEVTMEEGTTAQPRLSNSNNKIQNLSPTSKINRTINIMATDNELKSACNQLTVVTNQEKRKLTRRYLVTVLSICYAISLVVFGVIVFIGDAVKTRYPLPQAFCAYMLLVSFAYFLFLYIDIRLHVARIEYNGKVQSKLQLQQVTDCETSLEQDARKLNLAASKTISHEYCFIMGRHGGSFYLKFGAAWFAFGLLVYSILQISYQIEFISANGDSSYQCASYVTLALDILFPIYSTFTLFFTVKYMNVVINVHQGLARFCLMHAIGTSLAFWIFTIIRETTDSIAKSDVKQYGQKRDHELNETFAFVYHDCGKPIALNSVHQQFAPYLFPFIIEYCILNVGIWFTIYRNINRCPKKASKLDANLSLQSQTHDASDHENDYRVSTVVYADCHSSFCGMFAGLLVLTLTFVCTILMFVGVQNTSHLNATVSFVTATFELGLMIVMSVATIVAYTRTIQLDMTSTDCSATLDDVLLFLAIPAYVMEMVVTLAPAIYYQMFYRACISIASTVQVFIQTAFIVDGLRRCANDSELRKRKPGRELVIFLTISNVSLWVYNTLSVKTALADDERYSFYGVTLWNILDHVSMPLIMFYRFHASVCLVDMWNHAYEPKLH